MGIKTMSMQLTIENELESYEVLKGLLDRKEKINDTATNEVLDGLIDQFEGHNAYIVLVENRDN